MFSKSQDGAGSPGPVKGFFLRDTLLRWVCRAGRGDLGGQLRWQGSSGYFALSRSVVCGQLLTGSFGL